MKLNSDTLKALNTAVKTIFQSAFSGAKTEYQKIAMVVPSNKGSNTYPWLGNSFNLREWVGERVIQNLKEYDYTIKNKKYEGTVAIPEEAIEDDDIGLYNPLIANMGDAAAKHPDELIFGLLKAGTSTLCYDKQNFFDTDHPVLQDGKEVSVSNYKTGSSAAWYLLDTSRPVKPLIYQKRKEYSLIKKDGEKDDNRFWEGKVVYGTDGRGNAGFGFWQMAYCSKEDLTAANFEAAYAAMCSFKGDNGKPLGIRPTVLVVPPSLRSKANSIVTADKLANGADNPNKNLVEVMDTTWLA
ncbi:MAG: Mu-like prophage major head subunit gpT family protein [Proteobacteria bacterium]|nr:Mu-like prophage major head subunit gpT family protein [Pseudomonadota bacterium]